MKFRRRIGFWMGGLLLLPWAMASLWLLPRFLWSWGSAAQGVAFFLAGGAFYVLLFEIIFSKPMRTYIFGHELTHAIAAWLSGSRVHDFHVSDGGGHVTVSESNFLIALAPYIVPIYTSFILLAYFICGFFWPMAEYRRYLLLAVGLSWAFHVGLTLHAVAQGQPDIQKTGIFFSTVFILLVNAWVVAGLWRILFADAVSLKSFAQETFILQGSIWRWILIHSWHGLEKLVQTFFSSNRAG